MKLFVDDIRKPPDNSWHLVRNVTDAIRILANHPVEEVSLDHDITCFNQVNGSEHSSSECFQAVAYYIAAMPDNLRPKTVTVHTANPVGGDIICSILQGKVENLIKSYLKYDLD